MKVRIPRLIVAGLSGDTGKTITGLSLVSGFRRKGVNTAVFKKGPDYIDAAWLSRIAGRACRNLDTFMVPAEQVRRTFTGEAVKAEVAVIEGNRGIFDGMDASGTHSTAQLAKLLKTPVILVVNVTKTTRTVAAMVKGCQAFDPELPIAGVILNQVAGSRHRQIVTDAIHQYCHLPVLGAIPKLGDEAKLLPGRHLGLVPPAEYAGEIDIEGRLLEIADKYLDVEGILEIARKAEPLDVPEETVAEKAAASVRIGYFSDSVFTFYYPENLEALEEQGAELVPISSLESKELPNIDGLYIGGGFPETQAEKLTRNTSLLAAVRNAAEAGLPIYAECGGLIYLCRSLATSEGKYAMAGVFPFDLKMERHPVGHGYVRLKVSQSNPYFPDGLEFNGHEFHYSHLVDNSEVQTCLEVLKGVGVGQKRDGLMYKNTLACYTHIHADGVRNWAENFIKLAKKKTFRIEIENSAVINERMTTNNSKMTDICKNNVMRVV